MVKKTLISNGAIDLRDQKMPEENLEMKLSADKEQGLLQLFEAEEKPLFIKNDKWPAYGKLFIYLLIFFAPLFFLPLTIAPLEINKQILGITLVLISFVCYLADIISSKKIIYSSSIIVFAVLSIVVSVSLSYFFSDVKSTNFFGSLMQSDNLMNFIVYGLAFFLACVYFKKEDFKKIGIVFLTSYAIVNIVGILQFFGKFIFPFDFARQKGFNAIGSLFNYGIYITFGLLLIFAALSELKISKLGKIVLVAVSLIVVVELVALNFQLLWVSIVIMISLFLGYRFAQPVHDLKSEFNLAAKQKNQVGLPLFFLIISLFFLLSGSSLPQILKVPNEIKPDFFATLEIAKENISVKNLILGSGPASFQYAYAFYHPLAVNETDFWGIKFNQGFSFFFTFIITGGVLGISTFLFLVFSFVRLVIKNYKNSKAIIVAFGVVYLFLELFLSASFSIQFLFIFLGLGLIVSFTSSVKEFSLESKSKTVPFAAFILAVSLIAGSMAVLYAAGQKYAAAVYYGKALASSDYKVFNANLIKALSLDSNNDLYLRELSQYYIFDINRMLSETNESLQKNDKDRIIQEEIAYAVQLAQKATVVNSRESVNWSNLADIYEKIMPMTGGADMFAEKNYNEAMKLDPKNPLLPVSSARVLIASADMDKIQNSKDSDMGEGQKKKLDDARVYLDKAVELKADYAPAHFQIAMIYIRQGKMKEAIEKLVETKQYAPFDSNLSFQLGALYYDENQFGLAQEELERTILLNENYSNARYILGLIYDKNGKKGKAIDQFKKILSLNGNNDHVKKILKNLLEDKNALDGLELKSESAAQSLPVELESETKEEKDISKR